MTASKVIRNFRLKTAQEKVGKVVRASAIETYSRAILRTPVDTGRARANWGLNVSTDGLDKSGAVTINKITTDILTDDYRAGFTLINSLSYIERLENGYSGQAPQGMVAITALEFPAIVEQIAISQ